MVVRIGVSGWSYRRWRGDFYPARLPASAELGYVAARMTAAEVNASFYRLQRPSTYLRWAAVTPDAFRFAVKGPRFITHMKRLRDCREPLARFLASGPLWLGHRLGPVLWQLPERQQFDRDRLADFLALLPRTVGSARAIVAGHDPGALDQVPDGFDANRPLRHVLEPRHPSFGGPDVAALLRSFDVALAVSDSAGRFPCFAGGTGDLTYVRLHGHERLYFGGYDDRLLDEWADRLREWHGSRGDVWVFFDNDADGRAPHDAIALSGRMHDLLPPAPPNRPRAPDEGPGRL